ncbi:MAG: methyltransferase [Bacilli bacterium]|nr:methyltransferase [Bacilli bacterium]MBQ6282650.1 methyltransferase [Bacilli bacterium]
MNNKVLVEVIVPLLEERYQMFIPISKRISTIIKLIEKALKEMTNGYYPDKDNSVIIDVESGNVYDINITVKESKMINGSKIILI